MVLHINSEDINKYVAKVPQSYVEIVRYCDNKEPKHIFCDPFGLGGKRKEITVNSYFPSTMASTATPSPSPAPSQG